MPITWDEKTMSTGVPTIDAQHQELFRRFNAFHAALLKGQATAELSSIVEFLSRYAESHFTGEEALVTKHACPAAARNKLAHHEFRESVAALRKQMAEGGLTSSAAITVEPTLAQWLRTHICTVDVEMRGTAGCRRKAS
jgi:hemerythrin